MKKLLLVLLVTFSFFISQAAKNTKMVHGNKVIKFKTEKKLVALFKNDTYYSTVTMTCSDGSTIVTANVTTVVNSDTGAVVSMSYKNTGNTCPTSNP